MLNVVEMESCLLEKPICRCVLRLNLKCVYVSHPWYLEHVVAWMVHSENVRFAHDPMLGRLRQPQTAKWEEAEQPLPLLRAVGLWMMLERRPRH